MFSGSVSCTGDFEFDTPVTSSVPGNLETIPGIHNSHRVGLKGIYSAPRDKLLPKEVDTYQVLCRSHRAEHTLLLANFRFPVLGLGVRAFHIVSMLSEALISLGDGKDRHLWPFLVLGLGTAPGYCWGHCLTAQVLLRVSWTFLSCTFFKAQVFAEELGLVFFGVWWWRGGVGVGV